VLGGDRDPPRHDAGIGRPVAGTPSRFSRKTTARPLDTSVAVTESAWKFPAAQFFAMRSNGIARSTSDSNGARSRSPRLAANNGGALRSKAARSSPRPSEVQPDTRPAEKRSRSSLRISRHIASRLAARSGPSSAVPAS